MDKKAKNRLLLLLGILIILSAALILVLIKIGLFEKPELILMDRGPYNYVYTEHEGSFSNIAEAQELTDELVRAQNIKTEIPCGVYLSNPASTEEDKLQWRVGYLVEDSMGVEKPLNFATIKRSTFIMAKINTHPAIAPFKTYPALEAWILDNKYETTGPAVELYYNGRVESMFPVKEKALE